MESIFFEETTEMSESHRSEHTTSRMRYKVALCVLSMHHRLSMCLCLFFQLGIDCADPSKQPSWYIGG